MKDTIKYLLHYLGVDLRKITEIFVDYTGSKEMLKPSEQRILNAVFDMFHQQTYMHENNVHTCANRIISIFQPHLRPLKEVRLEPRLSLGLRLVQ